MDQILQNNTATNPQLRGKLLIAQAEYLRANLYIANAGVTSIIVILCFFFWGEDLAEDLMLWLTVGLGGTIARLLLMYFYRSTDCFVDKPVLARKYLYLHTFATFLSGSAFAVGWVILVPHLTAFEQLVYLLTIVALLFGGLFAYAPFLPAYIAFCAPALWISPLLLDLTREIYITGLNFGVWLISLVSTMFAYRFSNSFKMNRELEYSIYSLLDEVSIKRDEAVSANLAKTRFLASVSHDLRQPMQAVSLSLNTLQQLILRKAGGQNASSLIEENLVGLQHSVQYLNAMFDALLDISRLDAGALNVKVEYQEIETLIKSLDYEFSSIAAREGLQFETVVPKNFHKIQVKVDTHLLERLLRNLITNAVRYTSKGGIRLSIRIKESAVDIRVVDTGLGIAPEMRAKIFDEFIQLRNPLSKDKNVGMGLGLSIAKRLSTVLNTKIRLHSHQGIGSVFAFKLQAKKSTVAATVVGDVPQERMLLDFIEGSLLVVIDDDPEICEASKAMLELCGADVIVAESSDAAIQSMIYSSRLPDLILSDYRLVDETGLECVRKIREEFNHDIPAIIMTGDTAPAELHLLKEAGLEILYKPFSADILMQAIARNIDKANTLALRVL